MTTEFWKPIGSSKPIRLHCCFFLIIIIIKKGWQCKAEREWHTPYQSEDPSTTNKQTNNNDLLEKYGGTKNCIYKD